MSQSRRRVDIAKHRRWQRTIAEAARSGLSIREFCRQRKLTVSHFYWWQRRLEMDVRKGLSRKADGGQRPASFALVSDDPAATDAGIELVLGDGRRLRIHKGVDGETLRAVLAAMESAQC
jgi:transposase